MKKLSKLTAQAAVAVSLLSVAAPTFTSVVQASSVEPPVKKPVLSSEMDETDNSRSSANLSSEIQKNLEVTQNYDNSVEMSIKKTPELEKALQKNNMSYADLNRMVSQVNRYLKKNKHEISQSLKFMYVNGKLRKNKHSGTCSKALRFIGFVHSGAYKLAAAMLGITGPTAVIVPLLIGLIYQAGALFC
ncbi:hypothetical protein KQ229_07490 [Lactobacillus helveticus]|uniref:Uncharacterized protein n=1 Tax=Lactobacillus helveticus CIRM-BIA 951 TaxID=1226334 RepID=U6F078_LACHE|nr:hypothetical protein [Lactobacillus helveticus]ANZ56668.1 hypothetical protein BCM45_10040 [Lactobacillus helveticus]AQY53118.1 hypothetical protein BCM44_02885 [Lactobacillus helveticus]MBU6034881.1 hypothetical protein [Lactobacillus helveticus]MBW1220547.1 hypothetical protein [Lactobacillus helveticus]MDY0875914.1 hypothetical protein [Lactobacillus helveticus]